MPTLITTALIAILFASILIYLNLKKARQGLDFELKENCLLSRYPIVFLSGYRSLFYFYKYWNWVPYFLSEHGYEVIVLNLPWRGVQARRRRLKHFLQVISKEKLPIHVVGDKTCLKELYWLVKANSPFVKSCWLLEEMDANAPKSIQVDDLRPKDDGLHRVFFPQAPTRPGLQSRIWGLILRMHNLFNTHEGRLEPQPVGHPALCDTDTVKYYYLDFAISLAENDVRCSH